MKRTKRNKFPVSDPSPRSARNALNRDERVERTWSPFILFFFSLPHPSFSRSALKRKFRTETLKRETYTPVFHSQFAPTKLVFMYVTSGVITRCSPLPSRARNARRRSGLSITRHSTATSWRKGRWSMVYRAKSRAWRRANSIPHNASCALAPRRCTGCTDGWWLDDELDSKTESCRGCVPLALVLLCWPGPINVIGRDRSNPGLAAIVIYMN